MDRFLSLFLSFFLSFFFFLLFGTGWDGIRLLFVVGSELSAVSGSQLQLLLSSAQVGGTEERAGGFPIWLPSLVFDLLAQLKVVLDRY